MKKKKALSDEFLPGTMIMTARVFENENRLEIYELVKRKTMNISEISERIGLSYQNTHAHVKYLEKVGLVRREKQDKMVKGRPVLVVPTGETPETLLKKELKMANSFVEGMVKMQIDVNKAANKIINERLKR